MQLLSGMDVLRSYLSHTVSGVAQRAIARQLGCAPSTICRQMRRVEARRDDPLFDCALSRVSTASYMEGKPMTSATLSDAQVEKEARRILRRLTESGAVLVVSPGMEKAVVMRDNGNGRPVRIAVLDRSVAEAFALRDWIQLESNGRILRYGISTPGRAALKRMLDDAGRARVARKDEAYRLQHIVEGEKVFLDADGDEVRKSVNLAESPLGTLARRRGADGTPFLSHAELTAGERLREDFERAQMGPSVSQNWDRFLSAGARGGPHGGTSENDSAAAARTRVQDAIVALGPGLSDIAMRCCCFLEGLEGAERRLGWSARSGKIVLKIALGRLVRHYGLGEPTQERAPESKSA
jgi:transposase-like protein